MFKEFLIIFLFLIWQHYISKFFRARGSNMLPPELEEIDEVYF